MDVPKKNGSLDPSEIKPDIFAENTSVNVVNSVINDNATICTSHVSTRIIKC